MLYREPHWGYLSKQSDYDNRYHFLNGKVIQKTLTSHKFFNKVIFFIRSSLGNWKLK